ncbi:MAG: hypothetical protein ACE5KG_03290 [Nitrososphaerales archaeon]
MAKEGINDEIGLELEDTLKIGRAVVRAYMFSLRRRTTTQIDLQNYFHISADDASSLIAQLIDYGLGIESAEKGVYKVLHPRMGLTNVWNLLYPNPRDRPKTKRLVVDRMAAKLTKIYEDV